MTNALADLQVLPNRGWDPRITAFQFRRIVTTYAVVSERYLVLIDTLVSPAAAQFMVEHMAAALAAGRQLLVINTHADWDHSWGNALFVGPTARYPAPIIAHRLCRERILAGAWREYLLEQQAREPAIYGEVRLEPPTITFDGALTIDGGDLTFELIHTPGHKPDHVSIFIPELRTLFPGDAAEDPLPLVYAAADVPLLRASFERLLALQPQTVLYHHALGSIRPDVLHQNIAYFDAIEHHARAALAHGPLPAEPTPDTVEQLLAFPFAAAPHVEHLEDDEQRAFYLEAHRNALLATLAWVRHSMDDLPAGPQPRATEGVE